MVVGWVGGWGGYEEDDGERKLPQQRVHVGGVVFVVVEAAVVGGVGARGTAGRDHVAPNRAGLCVRGVQLRRRLHPLQVGVHAAAPMLLRLSRAAVARCGRPHAVAHGRVPHGRVPSKPITISQLRLNFAQLSTPYTPPHYSGYAARQAARNQQQQQQGGGGGGLPGDGLLVGVENVSFGVGSESGARAAAAAAAALGAGGAAAAGGSRQGLGASASGQGMPSGSARPSGSGGALLAPQGSQQQASGGQLDWEPSAAGPSGISLRAGAGGCGPPTAAAPGGALEPGARLGLGLGLDDDAEPLQGSLGPGAAAPAAPLARPPHAGGAPAAVAVAAVAAAASGARSGLVPSPSGGHLMGFGLGLAHRVAPVMDPMLDPAYAEGADGGQDTGAGGYGHYGRPSRFHGRLIQVRRQGCKRVMVGLGLGAQVWVVVGCRDLPVGCGRQLRRISNPQNTVLRRPSGRARQRCWSRC